mmetsp:Transcript_3534/g.8464  ORF Transcript_3534/g.8464 Transcript_3534/m.8464 type:complete len:133 (+) Transcript_3534:221-619(+)
MGVVESLVPKVLCCRYTLSLNQLHFQLTVTTVILNGDAGDHQLVEASGVEAAERAMDAAEDSGKAVKVLKELGPLIEARGDEISETLFQKLFEAAPIARTFFTQEFLLDEGKDTLVSSMNCNCSNAMTPGSK